MAIVISPPNSNKTVVIPEFNSMYELLESSTGHLKQLSYSFLFFRWLLAYSEVFSSKVFTDEALHAHLEAAAMAYRNEINVETLKGDEIAEKIEETISSKEFIARYKPFIDNFSTEIFNVFANGALAFEDDEISIDTTSNFRKMRVGQA